MSSDAWARGGQLYIPSMCGQGHPEPQNGTQTFMASARIDHYRTIRSLGNHRSFKVDRSTRCQEPLPGSLHSVTNDDLKL
eukprot:7729009-Pyramimonas_sp.AAC.1